MRLPESGFPRFSNFARRYGRFLALPVALAAVVSFVAFRQSVVITVPNESLSSPLEVPPGWAPPPVPPDNPITTEKFILGRFLFYEKGLSGDDSVSCGSCHQQKYAFSSGVGARPGAFGHSSKPARTVPRLMNLAYDSVYTWDGHIHSLEQQVGAAIVKRGDFEADTNKVKSRISANPAYQVLFTKAFGSSDVTIDRISKAIATFERCLISANSPYDRYSNGDTNAMTMSAKNGMKLFFNTTKTNCAGCHSGGDTVHETIFSDCNYYRTGTFDSSGQRGGGYSMDTNVGDPGRAGVTKDSADIGRFRTPNLRNIAVGGPYGANGSVKDLFTVIHRYNEGGQHAFNQDRRIQALGLSFSQETDIYNFLYSLTDSSFLTNPMFANPGAASARVDDHWVADNISVYPNPATNLVTITSPDISGRVDASIISSRGTIVWRNYATSENGRLQLDLSKLPNGAYTVALRTATTQKLCKVVLER